MGWVKLDDSFFRHHKAIRAGRDGRILYIAGLCYCGGGLTDGFIPSVALPILAAETGISKIGPVAEALVSVGLWEQSAGGFTVHDYLDYNRSSDKVRENRDAAAERMRRMRSQDVRANTGRTSEKVRQQEETRTDRAEQSRTETPLPPEGDAPKPFDLLVAMCEVIGTNPTAMTERDKAKELAVAKRLIANAATIDEIREITRYLKGQSWVTAGVDLSLIDKQIAKWRMNGRPNSASNGRSSRSITADHAGEDRAYLERGLPPVWGSANGGIDKL